MRNVQQIPRRDFITRTSATALVGLAAGFELLFANEPLPYAEKVSPLEGDVDITKLLREAGLEFTQPFKSYDQEAGADYLSIRNNPAITCKPDTEDVTAACCEAVEALARTALYYVLKDPPGTWKTITTPTLSLNPFVYHLGERDRLVELQGFVHLGKQPPSNLITNKRITQSIRRS